MAERPSAWGTAMIAASFFLAGSLTSASLKGSSMWVRVLASTIAAAAAAMAVLYLERLLRSRRARNDA